MNRAMHFIEPLDVLFLRGNKLFGDPGSYGESLMPPWPSMVAGALRSALLAHRGIDLANFAKGEVKDEELGTPERPGSFRVTAFHLARRRNGVIEPLLPLPADLVVVEKGSNLEEEVRRIAPSQHCADLGIQCSAATPSLAVLPERQRSKPKHGYWLTGEGWHHYLRGEQIDVSRLVPSKKLWRIDMRIGVGLDLDRRAAAEGALFTSQGIALGKAEHSSCGRDGADVGFLVETAGVKLPDELMLRFGGDGRGALATCTANAAIPEPDYKAIVDARRCRMILTSPGLFDDGWLPTGATGNTSDLRFDLHGVAGHLACAAVPRAEVVSGFDIAKRRPKAAQRVAPTGSVYWLDKLNTTSQALRNLADQGLWSDPVQDPARCAEGFNRIAFAAY